MSASGAIEPILAGIVLILYFGYHAFLFTIFKKFPLSTNIGHNHLARRRWCDWIAESSENMVAIQCIRNTIMSSALLASTSLSLAAIASAYIVSSIEHEGLNGFDVLANPSIKAIHKFFVVVLSFSVAFFCYMQSIRAANHCGFLITPPQSAQYPLFTPKYTCKVLIRGADFHTMGTRMFYFAFIVMLWIFGPLPPLITTTLLVPFLFYLDIVRKPKNSE